MDWMAPACSLGVSGIWLPDTFAAARKKTEKTGMLETVDSETIDSGERIFLMNMVFLKSWPHRWCSIRSSERWRRKQRLRKMPSLPDIRHQIAKLLILKLRC